MGNFEKAVVLLILLVCAIVLGISLRPAESLDELAGSPVEAATANLELAKRAEETAIKLQRFGQRSAGDVTQARYFRLQAELELALAKRRAGR